MKVDKLNLERVFERTERLEAPLFQRPYVWKQDDNWEPLWASMKLVAERHLEEKTIHPHFLGTIVLDQLETRTGQIHVRQIIDGQQRLTTLQLALAACRDICEKMNESRYSKAFARLTMNDLPPRSDDPDDVFKVWPTNADREDFRQVMKARSPSSVRKLEHSNPDDEWLIPDAYLYFSHLVVIDLERDDDAQEIFETLNALGTPLLPADLVKNYLFHQAEFQKEDTAKLYEEYWQRFDNERAYWRKAVRQGRLKRPRLDLFLGHFVTLMLREEVVIAQLFSAYRDFVENSDNQSATKHMEMFRCYADVYKSFEGFGLETREGVFFYRLDQLDTTTIFPLLLEVVKRYNTSAMRQELYQILGDLESFFVRRTICELTAKNYNKLVIDVVKELNEINDFSASAIRRLLLKQEAEVSRWPNDDEFKKAWMQLDFYKRLKKTKLRMILEALEETLYTGMTERVRIERKLTIEHLLPKEWEQHWPLSSLDEPVEKKEELRNQALHKIGNLTLLTKKLNPSISNGPWANKRKQILRHSALNLNRTLPEIWDEKSIQTRSKELFALAIKIWPHP